MAINVADQFQYLGKKSLDARGQYATLAAMKAVTDANINEGCFAYCVETDKYYTFKSTNTVDDTLGKWREYGVEEMPSEDMASVMTPLPSYSGGSANPTGTIISFMGVYAPQGYLKCDGTVYNIADYQRLADFFKAQFGSANKFGGDGTTTFAVPNLLGEFLRMTGTNSHANQGSGAAVGTHQDGTEHTNTFEYNQDIGIYLDGNTSAFNAKMLKQDSVVTPEAYYATVGSKAINAQTGYAATYTSRPTNTSVLYCIKD